MLGRALLRSPLRLTATRAFHAGVPLFEDAGKEIKAADGEGAIDKENPLHAPESFRTWRNVGYKNLAPMGWEQWDDLPAPYNKYSVKVDPKDVENPGLLWKLATNWRTGIPLAGLFSLPLFVFDVVIIDERFELMLIFWSTIAVFNFNFGSAVKSTITDQIDEIRDELTTAEGKYTSALAECVDTYRKAQHVPEYLSQINAGERALRATEAAARSRQLHIDERNRMQEMLNYLVMVRESRDAAVADQVTTRARLAAEDALTSNPKLVEQTTINAIAALKASAVSDSVVEDLYKAEYAKAQAAVEEELAATKKASSTDRELFAKRFGFASEVTEEMMAKAESDPAAMALLTAKTGGNTPTVGAKITQKMPIDY